MARKAFLIRVDEKLLAELRRWAGDEFRSLNGQIEFLLRDALRQRGRRSPEEEQGSDEEVESSD
jgi:hypothetical protein